MKAAVKSMCAAIAAVFTATVLAAVPTSTTKFVPDKMNYQGYLANPSSGAAYMDGIYQLECRLYRTQSGGTAIWGGRYSVYVKDGYFNIMLGDSSAIDLGYTYANADLWRALWYDSAASEKNNLWLGVKPLQGPTGSTLTSPSEISPRQQLLAAPYAFRAHAAEYAEQSIGAFKVNGALTVTGSVTFPSAYTLPFVKVQSSPKQLTLGGTSNSATNPSVYNYASNMYNYAYYNMNFSTTSGNIKFTVPSGKSLQVANNSLAVTNANTTVKSSSTASIEASSIKMKGALSYGKYSGTGFVKPFVMKKVTFHMTDGKSLIEANGDYNWIVAGYDTNPVGGWDGNLAECYTALSGSNWYVYVKRWNGGSEEDTVTVHLLGIHRSISSDNR